MPEFVQEDLKSWKSIIVHFESHADLKAFGKLLGQRLTTETKSCWHPELTIDKYMDKRYADKEDKRFEGFPEINLEEPEDNES